MGSGAFVHLIELFMFREHGDGTKKNGLWIVKSRGRLVEVRGIEPLSENIQRNSPTCVADDLVFRSCPRPPTGLERPLAQNFLVRRR